MSADIIPLGARLRERREELGLSQAQAARELAVARTAYRLWEMEAARPAPDRWRAIARWLGISVSAMLLAGELIGEQDAVDAERAALGAGTPSAGWDNQSDAAEGDFFTQQRTLIDDQARSGALSPQEAASLHDIFGRLQGAMPGESVGWHPGRFRRRFPNSPFTPSLSRAALAATAVGIPADDFDNALLLISELVSNSVNHAATDWVDVAITLDTNRLRIDVSDQSTQPIRPRTPDTHNTHRGLGLTLVAQLPTRWGIERHSTGKTIWIELDLTP